MVVYSWPITPSFARICLPVYTSLNVGIEVLTVVLHDMPRLHQHILNAQEWLKCIALNLSLYLDLLWLHCSDLNIIIWYTLLIHCLHLAWKNNVLISIKWIHIDCHFHFLFCLGLIDSLGIFWLSKLYIQHLLLVLPRLVETQRRHIFIIPTTLTQINIYGGRQRVGGSGTL